jgi:aryl-alcohol dehydrogenase-like predicted oxidoreductase
MPAPMLSKAVIGKRRLGTSGLSVSEICLGTMNFGGPTDESEGSRIVADAAANGCNFIDTADAYTDGRSEEITGRAIRANRHHWILATKVANTLKDSQGRPFGGGLSRRWVMAAVDGSLKRLGLDHIDLYYTHKTDPLTPWSDIVRTFGDLIRDGKIRYWGISNVRAWHIPEIAHQCRLQNVAPPVSLQPYYNLFNRQPEVELLPAAREYGLGVTTYSPVARGVLSGKYVAGSNASPDTRAGRGDKRMLETEWRPENLAMAQRIGEHVTERGGTMVQFAVQWVLNNAAVSSVIAGPRTFEQWRGYVDYASYRWGADDEALVNSLVASGHPSVPGYTDPQYPLDGRFPITK